MSGLTALQPSYRWPLFQSQISSGPILSDSGSLLTKVLTQWCETLQAKHSFPS